MPVNLILIMTFFGLGIHGVNMFGVNHNAVVYLLEQLYGAQLCRNYKFRYQQYTRKEEEEVFYL